MGLLFAWFAIGFLLRRLLLFVGLDINKILYDYTFYYTFHKKYHIDSIYKRVACLSDNQTPYLELTE